ncbi:MAG: PfkB family carbohydrate kinase [Candidatus Nanopelagicales bacterium]
MLNLAPVVPLPREVILAADPLVVNEHEGELALALLSPEGDVPAGASHEGVARALVGVGVASVVMTLGGEGALVLGHDIPLTRVPAARVEVVDSTGAGDAFRRPRDASGRGRLLGGRRAVRVPGWSLRLH